MTYSSANGGAFQPAVAAAAEAGIGPGSFAEVAVSATLYIRKLKVGQKGYLRGVKSAHPDPSGRPVLGDVEGD